MSQFRSESQKLEPSAPIHLFILDATNIGGSIQYFTESAYASAEIKFDGKTYIPIPVKFDGMETTGVGQLPTPTLTLDNTNPVVQALVNTYGDLNTATVTRIRTYERFLDGQPDADPSAFYGPDVFSIDQRTSDTPTEIVWTLSAAVDQQGRYIGRSMIRDTCMWRYRAWNAETGSFDYTNVLCPYTGTNYYDINDNPVANPSQDVPSRRLSCCKTRFGAGQPLPFGGFPGLARV